MARGSRGGGPEADVEEFEMIQRSFAVAALAASLAAAGPLACSDEGSLEEAGRAMDGALESASEAARQAGESPRRAVSAGGEAAAETARTAADRAREALEKDPELEEEGY